MPQLGLEVTEGTVAAVHVAVGGRVAEGDPLLELETDKALTDVVAPRAAVVRSVEVQIGDTVAIGVTLVVLADELGEAIDATASADKPSTSDNDLAAEFRAPTSGSETMPSVGDARVRAAPVARRAAAQLGVTLGDVPGTGPRGRITLKDVERAAGAQLANGSSPTRRGGADREGLEPLSPTRRAVARRMTSSQQIPQFALSREIDASWLLGEKQRISDDGDSKVSINDLLVQSLAETVLRHPDLALSYVESDPGGKLPQYRRRDAVDVGLAVATGRGLLVPVLRHAHDRRLHELASERVRLVGAARSGRLALEEMTGATITLSSLASFGVDTFAAMLNPGESAILAVGRTLDKVVARGRGLAIVPTLTLTLTIDHRVMDGASGGAALAELADLLEGGMTWRT
jgi:pyruvate dehydrogenase E2 component (dihydrolipoamide acetyltransferase)